MWLFSLFVQPVQMMLVARMMATIRSATIHPAGNAGIVTGKQAKRF